MKKLLSIFLVSMFVFVGCVPKNGIQEKIENVPVEINKASKAEDEKINPEVVVPKTEIVMISDFAFAPNVVTVNAGDSVLWKHDDVAAHDVVSVDGLFKSPVLEKGGSFSFKFEKAGTYEYYCSIHPSMRGTVVVK